MFEFVHRTSKVRYVRPRSEFASHVDLCIVCKHWKTVAYETPSLWARMVTGFGGDWTTRALSLSGGAKLHIDLGSHQFKSSGRELLDSTYGIFKHSTRFYSLAISPGSWLQMSLITASLQVASVPQLECLRITPAAAMFHGYDLSDRIFHGAPPPVLRSVTIADCTFNSTSPIFRSPLTSLSLIRCEAWLSLDAVLDTLALLPCLEELEWDMTRAALVGLPSSVRLTHTRFHTPRTDRGPVPLHFMKSLTLQCPMFCIVSIVPSISLPALCEVNLMDDYSLSGIEDLDLRKLDDLLLHLDISLGEQLSRACSDASEVEGNELRIDDYHSAVCGRGAFSIEIIIAQRAPNDPVPHAIQTMSSVPRGIYRCSFTLSIPATIDFLADEVDEDSSRMVHRSVMRRIVQHISAWPAINSVPTRLVVSHSYFADPFMWLAAMSPLKHVPFIHIANRADRNVVEGFAIALGNLPGCLAGLAEIKLTVGPMIWQFSPETSQKLACALQTRYQHGGSHVRLTLLNEPESERGRRV